MFHNRRHNNKINYLHERMLRIVYKEYKSSFAELRSEDKSFTVHHKNVQKVASEMHKIKNELCPKIMLDLFEEVTHPYNLRNLRGLICGSYKIKTVRYGTETITYLGPKIWSIIPDKIRESASLQTFRQKMGSLSVFLYICMYVYVYDIYIYVCVCIWIHIFIYFCIR